MFFDESQRAMAAAQALPFFESAAEERQWKRLRQYQAPLASTDANGKEQNREKAAEKAAEAFHIGQATVERAKKDCKKPQAIRVPRYKEIEAPRRIVRAYCNTSL